MTTPDPRPRVLIVGAGFGGLAAARALRRSDAEVMVIDGQNQHLFQPPLYQVATAALAPSNIAAPVRRVLRGQRNARTILGEARATDAATGAPVPGVAQGAIQGGRHAGRLIAAELRAGRRGADVRPAANRPAFRYRNKGEMTTIGRSRAVADLGFARFGGWFAWLPWSLVHVLFLVGFRNTLPVMADWVWQYVTFGRGARLITGQRLRVGAHGGGDPDEDHASPDESTPLAGGDGSARRVA